ncbi:carbohydrate ABC transporter permease [Acuticoccus kandeliae]|uniref:carbohydrate ABC transporter permease n=1 Tax=Acuticoccus kandeliae TaxID=2073160 RepID=UPI000D3E2A67|nr:sugar ABC transporter permease [Acuticoccus kandeliae]
MSTETPALLAVPPADEGRRRWRMPDPLFGFLLLLPSLALFLGLIVYPIAQAFLISFHDVSTLTLTGPYTGLTNYKTVLAQPEFWRSFVNTIIWTIGSLIGQIGLGILIALLLNTKFHGQSFARGVVILPYMLSSVVVVMIWQWMLNDLYGVIDAKLMEWEFTMMPVPWLTRMPNAMITLIVIGTWKLFPFVVITILARLQSIPGQLYEAARIDGAGAFSRFRDITWPHIKSLLLFILLLRGIWDFKEFDLIFLLTGGGPQIGTQTLPLLIYKAAFGQLHLGRGAAIAILMLLIMTVMFAVYFWYNNRQEKRGAL